MLSTDRGLLEHAELDSPREENGYCLDDNARALVYTARNPTKSAAVKRLEGIYFRFVLEALVADGKFHNRMSFEGAWEDTPSTDDHWGRAIWALGLVHSNSVDPLMRERAELALRVALEMRSPHLRSMSYAALGAVELLKAFPGDYQAENLLRDTLTLIGPIEMNDRWPWPEKRLEYANAVIPEAMIAAGSALDDVTALNNGFSLLSWLTRIETRGTHLSVTPAGGMNPDDARPSFDQQPIEVAALGEAFMRAWELSRDPVWVYRMERCPYWFLGWNDSGKAMLDPETGAGYDGLHGESVNLNRGAESTLALLTVFQLQNQLGELNQSWKMMVH
jgi:hypothetical protein